MPERAGSAYVRLEYRQAMEITVAGAAVFVALEAGEEQTAAVRLALNSVAPTIITAPEAERALVDAPPTPASFEAAGRAVAEIARPMGDVRASDGYRRAMVSVVVRRALEAATARAGSRGSVTASRRPWT